MSDYLFFRQLYIGVRERAEDLGDLEELRGYLRDERQPAVEVLATAASLRTRARRVDLDATAYDDLQWQLITMYALSRVVDLLLEKACPAGEPPPGFGITGGRAIIPDSDTDQLERGGWRPTPTPGWHPPRRLEPDRLVPYQEFLAGLGLELFEHAEAFSPFHHEIFAVVPDASATTVILEEVLWPGSWFGNLLVSRAGVRVRAPQHLIDPAVATTSTLYFTHRREPRPTLDASHGWGSNSQWRTLFGRFYADEEGLHLNWDGEVDLGVDRPASPHGAADDGWDPPDERREVLLHRCFVRGDLPADEGYRYPHTDRLTLTSAAWPLNPDSILTP